MKGQIISDWSRLNLSDPTHRAAMIGAFQHFMALDKHLPLNSMARREIQNFAMKEDFSPSVRSVLEKVNITPASYDLGYEQIYDIRDFTGTREDGFDLYDVEAGIAFSEIKPGQRAEVSKIAGERTTVYFAKYMAALGWDVTWLENQKFWLMEDTAKAFRDEYYRYRASVAYAVIEAIASTYNVTWKGTEGDPCVSRDVETINYACEAVLDRCDDLGMGVTANTPLVLLAPVLLKGRIQSALAYNQVHDSTQRHFLAFNVIPVYTMLLSTENVYYICLPGRKAKGGYRQDLTLAGFDDKLADLSGVVGKGQYAFAIGDIRQFARCAIS